MPARGRDLEADGGSVSSAEADTVLGVVGLEVFLCRAGEETVMKVVHCESVPLAAVQAEGAVGAQSRCLIGEQDGAPSFTMRQFEIAPGGHTPKHTHGHEHEVFVLEGTAVVLLGTAEHALRAGTAVFVPPNLVHQFRNTGSVPLKFLCLIPHPLRGMSTPCVAACSCE